MHEASMWTKNVCAMRKGFSWSSTVSELYSSAVARATRTIGTAVLSLCWVASGRANVYYTGPVVEWRTQLASEIYVCTCRVRGKVVLRHQTLTIGWQYALVIYGVSMDRLFVQYVLYHYIKWLIYRCSVFQTLFPMLTCRQQASHTRNIPERNPASVGNTVLDLALFIVDLTVFELNVIKRLHCNYTAPL